MLPETNEVTIGPDGSGSLVRQITNPSTIVDGYDLAIPDAPPGLKPRPKTPIASQ